MSVVVNEDVEINNTTTQFCTFELSGRLFGVDILTVKEVNAELNFTNIYHANNSIKGYMNIRGQIYLVIDASLLFGFKKTEITKDSKVLIFKDNVDEPFGILVDKIRDIVEIENDKIIERRSKNDNYQGKDRRANKALTSGVAKLEDSLLVVINANGILKSVLEFDKDNAIQEVK